MAPIGPRPDERSEARGLALELAGNASAKLAAAPARGDRDVRGALTEAVDDHVVAHPDLDPDLLVAACEHLAGAHPSDGRTSGRGPSIVLGPRPSGVVYTPPELAAGLVAVALDETQERAGLQIVDPACGGGAFLLAVLRHLAARTGPVGVSGPSCTLALLDRITGIDVDPLAVHVARAALWLEVGHPDLKLADLDDTVLLADTLSLDHETLGRIDVIVGNPPFRSPLRGAGSAVPVGAPWAEGLGTYADHAAVFLAWAHHHVRPDGGRVVLIQPASVLASRDAADLRRRIDDAGELAGLWLDTQGAFAAAVHTTAPLIVRGSPHDEVRLWKGSTAEPLDSIGADHRPPPRKSSWSDHAAVALGLPEIPPTPDRAGTIGDLASATADFRDQYYGLVGHVVDLSPLDDPDDVPTGFAPLVTSGLIEPAHNAWGRREVRLHRQRWGAPALDLAAALEGDLSGWVEARRVPKVLVATQTRVVEAVVDEAGGWLPSVPTITVTTRPGRLWHLAAALSAPVTTLTALRRAIGTARTLGALKVSASAVEALPVPTLHDPWDEAVGHLRAASAAVTAVRVEAWRGHMTAFADAMAVAYEVPDDEAAALREWWLARLPDPFR